VGISLSTTMDGSVTLTAPPGLFVVDFMPNHEKSISSASVTVKSASTGGWSSQTFNVEEDLGAGCVGYKLDPSMVGKRVSVSTLGLNGRTKGTLVKEALRPYA
jgi:hypothetical protein